MITLENYEAGPGSYNLSQDLATRSQVYLNPPRPLIPRGKKSPSMFISKNHSKEFQSLCTPPPDKYFPSTSLTYRSASMAKFGTEERKDYFTMAKDRSPGPIYSYSKRNGRTCSFGKGEKNSSIQTTSLTSYKYDPTSIKSQIAVKIKGHISDKMYLKNLECTYKGKSGPGPAEYTLPSTIKASSKFPKTTSEKLKQVVTPYPGPGSYFNTQFKSVNQLKHFGGSKRSLDIRAYQHSNEFFR